MAEQPPLSFKKTDDCHASPLARKLLEIDGIEQVFLGSDFITLSKQSAQDWYLLKPLVLGILMESFVNGLPIYQEIEDPNKKASISDDPLVRQICDLLETRIRPAVAQDGGDITFEGFEEGVVYLRMKGACSGCPSSSATLKSGIENMLKYYVPEVLEVRQVHD